MTSARPMPRKAAGVHARELGDEIVVVAEATKQAHVLRGVTADLWRGLDSRRWPDVSDAEIDAAVSELVRAELVTTGLTRRTLLARAGGVAVAAPLITIALPTIAMASSGTIPTTLTLLPATANRKFGDVFEMTATVTASSGPPPTGFVQLTDTAGVTGSGGMSAPIDSTGVATFSKLVGPSGPGGVADTFTATYPGDSTWVGSFNTASATFSRNGNKLTPVFAFSGINTAGKATYPLTVTVQGPTGSTVAPTGTVTLTVAGATVTNAGPVTLVDNGDGTSSAVFSITNPSGNNKAVSITANYDGSADPTYSSGTGTTNYSTT